MSPNFTAWPECKIDYCYRRKANRSADIAESVIMDRDYLAIDVNNPRSWSEADANWNVECYSNESPLMPVTKLLPQAERDNNSKRSTWFCFLF